MKLLQWDVELFGKSVILAYTPNELEAIKEFNKLANEKSIDNLNFELLNSNATG